VTALFVIVLSSVEIPIDADAKGTISVVAGLLLGALPFAALANFWLSRKWPIRDATSPAIPVNAEVTIENQPQ
jgi:hypothetical protein